MPHPVISANHVAVITGGASGIGLAAALRFAQAGMKVAIADLGDDRLKAAATKLSSAAPGGAAAKENRAPAAGAAGAEKPPPRARLSRLNTHKSLRNTRTSCYA